MNERGDGRDLHQPARVTDPKRASLSNLVGLVSLALLAGSLLGKPGLTSPSSGALLAGGGLLSLLTCLFVASLDKLQVRSGVLWGLGLLLWSSLAAVGSLDLHLSFISLSSLAGGVAILVSTSLLCTERSWWRVLARIGVGLSVTSAVFALYTAATERNWGRLSGNFTNPDTLAIVLFVGFCLTASLLSQEPPQGLTALLICAPILLIASAATLSRSALAAYGTAFVVVMLSTNQKTRRTLLKGLALLCLVLIPSLGFLVTSGKLDRLVTRVQSVATSHYDLPLRLEFLTGSWPCAFERPLLGSGPGTFALAYQEFRPPNTRAPGEYVNAAHNDTVQFLVECGTPGMFFWLLTVLYATKGAWKNRRESEATWMAACLSGLLVYSLFNFIVPVPTTLLWFFFAVGLSLPLSKASKNVTLSEVQHTALSALLLVFGLFAVVVGFRHAWAQHCIRTASVARDSLHWKSMAQALDGAIKMEPLNAEHRLKRAQLVQEMVTLFGRSDWSAQIAHDLKRAQELSPRNLHVLSSSFRYYIRKGELSKALSVAKSSHRYAPYDPRGQRRMAGIQVLKGNLGKATELLQAKDRESAGLLAQLFYHMGKEGLESLQELPPAQRLEVGSALRALAVKRGQSVLLDEVYDIILPLQAPQSLELEVQQAQDLRILHDPRWKRKTEELVRSENQEQEAYDQALLLWAELRGAASVDRLLEYIESYPEKTKVRLAASELLPPDLATELLEKGLERSPNDVQLLEKQGDLFASNGLPKIALVYYQKALKLGGGSSSLGSKIDRMEKF